MRMKLTNQRHLLWNYEPLDWSKVAVVVGSFNGQESATRGQGSLKMPTHGITTYCTRCTLRAQTYQDAHYSLRSGSLTRKYQRSIKYVQQIIEADERNSLYYILLSDISKYETNAISLHFAHRRFDHASTSRLPYSSLEVCMDFC